MNEATQMQSRHEWFISRLEKLEREEDRAALAALRRGLGKPPGTAIETHPYVMPYTTGMHDKDADAYYIVATLFGLYPCQSWRSGASKAKNNLGASLALLKGESDSTEKRFVALLNTHSDDLPDHLRQAISLLKSKDAPVNWLQLLKDIKGWNYESRSVQRDWAKGFWGDGREDASSDASQTNEGNNQTL